MTPINKWGKSREIADCCQSYAYYKIPEPDTLSDFSVVIRIFPNNKKTEVYVKTSNQIKYFKIIEVAQKNLPKMDRYYFDSLYCNLPKDSQGLCTVDAVKELCTQLAEYRSLFEHTYLESGLRHFDNYLTSKELFGNVKQALKILKEIDPSIDEIEQDIDNIKLFS